MTSNDKKGSKAVNPPWETKRAVSATTSKAPHIKSGLLWALIRLGELHDIPRNDLLHTAGLENANLEDPDRKWDYASGLKLWRFLLDRCPAAHLGLESAPLILLSEADLPRLVLAHASNLGEAINLLIELQGLVDSTQPLRFTIDPSLGLARLRFELAAELLPFAQPIESLVATTYLLLRNLVGDPFQLQSILFMHGLDRAVEPYQQFFGVLPTFDQHICEFVFEHYHLERPIVASQPGLGRHLAAYARTLLEPETLSADHSENPPTWQQRVLESLQNNPPSTWNLESTATILALGGRTLQRRLHQEQTSFDLIVDEYRQNKATWLLNSPELSLDEIASHLGYADRRGFQRAYKRWTGTTPRKSRSC